MNTNNTFNTIANPLKQACLLTSGNINDYNTMAIGWGTIGILWSKKVFIAYVKPIRYTYEFMEKNDIFTVEFFNDEYIKPVMYLGTKSGRDEDKVKASGLTPVEVKEHNTVTFKEAYHTIVCKKIYYQDLDIDQIPSDVIDKYYTKEKVHRMYIGEIIEEL